ncbi:CHAT domain-containing protein [Winogradskyella sp. 3972H.M.0a.05]|uniref:CHAT domain-containing protein n=1 Tax=Winogradskyella sp. 3972H.M.0a.05 TaxID=2950277 RepID=UPI003395B7F2
MSTMFEPLDHIIAKLNEGLDFVEAAKGKDYEIGKLYYALSTMYRLNYQIDNAQYYANKEFQLYQKYLDSKDVSMLDSRISNIDMLGLIRITVSDYDTAFKYAEEGLELSKTLGDPEGIAYFHAKKFNIYKRREQDEEIRTFIKDEKTYGWLDKSKLWLKYQYYFDIIDYANDVRDFDLAEEAIANLEEVSAGAHFSDIFIDERKAELYSIKGNYQKAIDIYESFKDNEQYQYVRKDSHAWVLLKLAKSYYKLGDIQKSKDYLNKAFFNNIISTPENYNFFTELSSENLLIEGSSILEKLRFKGEMALELYKKTKEAAYLSLAKNCYELLHEATKTVGRLSKEDKFISAETFKEVYGNLLDIYHNSWQQAQDEALFYKALSISDESKIVAVLNEISAIKQEKLFKIIPSETLHTERQLMKGMDSINRLLKANVDSESLIKQKDSLKQVFEGFKKDLKQTQPQYFRLKYHDDSNLKDIIEQNYSKYNIIHFFWGNSVVYVLNINGNTLKFDKISIDSLEDQVEQFNHSLRENTSTDYKALGYTIYTTLFQNYIDSNKKTILVSDDKLHLLPIEALNTGQDDNGKFLVELTSFLRLNSLAQRVVLPASKNKGLKLFAPFSTKSYDRNNVLPSSLDEVNIIGGLLDGEVFLDENASKNEFLNQINSNNIIHLATHSEVDCDNPQWSKIYFSNSKDEEPSKSILRLEELYSLNINSDLVTLSSCETGIGEEMKGKGVLSLSNAFTFAGVSSTVMSLWKIPDQETSQIIVSFYENLKEGQEKDIALQNAKVKYLSSTDDLTLKHPYYWAGFVISGDASPIVDNQSYWLYILGTLIICTIIIFLIRKNRKQD